MRSGDIPSVSGMFHYVVAARGVCRAEKQTGSADELVRAVKLGAVAVRHVGYARRFVPSEEYRRAAFTGSGGPKVARNRE
eukprot:140860-Pleurochrysis_carterae.AAC.1